MKRFFRLLRNTVKGSSVAQAILFFNNLYRESRALCYVPQNFAIFEEGARIENGVQLFYPERMIIKQGAIIHRGTRVNARGGFHLGRYSGISYDCTIMTVDHRILKAKSIPFDNRAILKPVYISDFVMIGAHVYITPGIKIGEGAVIGMGSVVNRDVKPLSIVMGNPATVIGFRDKDRYKSLKESNAFQSPIVDEYDDYLPLMIKRKYADFLKQINLK